MSATDRSIQPLEQIPAPGRETDIQLFSQIPVAAIHAPQDNCRRENDQTSGLLSNS
jgi:hypothetical protein